jgi:hypothetical protein
MVTVHGSNNVAKVAKTLGGIIGNQVRPTPKLSASFATYLPYVVNGHVKW